MSPALGTFRTVAAASRLALAALVLIVGHLSGAEPAPLVQGFSEPYRVINVASAETGIIDKLLVREGDRVREDQPLAVLDRAVHQAAADMAKASQQAQGELEIAKVERQLRAFRVEALAQLRRESFASDEELRRAQADLDVATAQVRSAEEKQRLRAIEYDKLLAQLNARTIRAPQSGVIAKVYKRRGEYLGPNDPNAVQLVQLDPLAVVFLVPRELSRQLAAEQPVTVRFTAIARDVPGTVEFVAPLVEAGSGTVHVRVRVDNGKNELRAGEPCQLVVPRSGTPTGSEVSTPRQR